jgi:hypothetical protein
MEYIKQRTDIEYNLKELTIILKESHILSEQIEVKSLKGINKIFDNQGQCGEEVKNIFNNKAIINCLVFGMTQTGKTGCMTSLIQYYILSYNIPIDNIYIISGLSDKEWKKDTKNRMPDSINKRVLHRANLTKTFFKDIRDKKNCLIIMDEIQIACEDTQTIKKTFEKCGFYDLEFLLKNDIKLVQFTATPDGHINDISDWKQHYAKIKLSPGIGYYGPKQAIEQGRVKQFKDLTICENVLELKTDIEKYIIPRYHLIRVPNKRENKNRSNNQNIVISNFRKIFGDNCEYNIDFLKVKKGDINDILKNEPIRHTFVFYCEILRCAKTQCKKYIGISYERFSNNINDSTIIQGSFGRLTGYDDNSVSICYTNLPSLENYIKLWNNDMEFKEGIEWNTKTTNYDTVDNLAYSTGTFNSVKHIEQLKDGCSEKVTNDRGEPIIKKFKGVNGENEGKVFFKKNLKTKFGGKGPNKTTKNDSGFYIRPLGKGKDRKEILSTTKMYKHRKWNLDGNASKGRTRYTWFPCYSDVTDTTTLEWWLIYYE